MTTQLDQDIAATRAEIERLQAHLEDLCGQIPAPDDDALPKALREVPCANGDQLQAALARDYEPGTHFVLRPGGDYGGSYTFRRPGTSADPVVVRGEPGRMVRFDGQIKMSTAWNAAAFLAFCGDGRAVDISARGARVTRCRFGDVKYDGMVYQTGGGHPDWRVDHCNFVDIQGAAVRSELVGDATRHRGGSFDHNHVNGHSCSGDNESVIIVQTDEFNDIDMTIADNLFENCVRGAKGEREIVKAATAGTHFLRNTIIRSNGGFISFRVANACSAIGNWLEDGSFIKAHGDDHVISNNVSTTVVAELPRGNCYSSDVVPKGCWDARKAGKCTLTANCKPGWTGARRMLAENNIGTIVLGTAKSSRDKGSHPPRDITLRGNASKAKIATDPIAGLIETGVGDHTNTARKLTAADVGCDAP